MKQEHKQTTDSTIRLGSPTPFRLVQFSAALVISGYIIITSFDFTLCLVLRFIFYNRVETLAVSTDRSPQLRVSSVYTSPDCVCALGNTMNN